MKIIEKNNKDLIVNIGTDGSAFWQSVGQLLPKNFSFHTEEKLMKNLGVFPVQQELKKQLEKEEIPLDKKTYCLLPLLRDSNIALFFDAGSKSLYLPYLSFPVFLYFYHSWNFDTEGNEATGLKSEATQNFTERASKDSVEKIAIALGISSVEAQAVIGALIIMSFTGML